MEETNPGRGSGFSPNRILEMLLHYDSLAQDLIRNTQFESPIVPSGSIRFLLSWVLFLYRLPFIVLYYVYIFPPLFMAKRMSTYITLALKIIARRSSSVRRTLKHIKALLKIARNIWIKICTTDVSELAVICMTTVIEIITALIWPADSAKKDTSMQDSTLSVDELTELLNYEEYDGNASVAGEDVASVESIPLHFRRSIRAMHHQVPVNPFRATIRIHKAPTPSSSAAAAIMSRRSRAYSSSSLQAGSTPRHGSGSAGAAAFRYVSSFLMPAVCASSSNIASSSGDPTHLSESDAFIGTAGAEGGGGGSGEEVGGSGGILMNYVDADSPASFPPTPFSRAVVMSRSAERVVTTMFAARDRLRVEALSVCRDEYSRMVAAEARTCGQYAIFDPKQTSDGIALTCGNHCVKKVGPGVCLCSRAMVPVHTNAFVYFEFSITVSRDQIPVLALGLSPPDCPLNVMAGNWRRSVGLYSDGNMLFGSHWFQQQQPQQQLQQQRPGSGEQREDVQQSGQGVAGGTAAASLSKAQRPPQQPMKAKAIVAGSTVGMLVSLQVPPGLNQRSRSSSLSQAPQAQNQLSKQQPQDQPCKEPLRGETLHQQEQHEPSRGSFHFHFTVNGEVVKHSVDAETERCLREVSELQTPLYPTVSLLSEDTCVWGRFSEQDVVYRSRRAIGAPTGVRVYCLDGSLLLEEGEN